MQQAAAAVAANASDLLESHSGGRYGRHVMIMVGASNNERRAVRGVRLARQGTQVTAVRCLGTPHTAALQRYSRRVVGWSISMIMIRLRRTTWSSTGFWASVAVQDCRTRRRLRPQSVEARASDRSRRPPLGVAADTGAAPGAAVRKRPGRSRSASEAVPPAAAGAGPLRRRLRWSISDSAWIMTRQPTWWAWMRTAWLAWPYRASAATSTRPVGRRRHRL